MDWTKPEPPPVKTGSVEVWPLVMDALYCAKYDQVIPDHIRPLDLYEAFRQRHEFGKAKYGVALQVENSRNPLNDLRDEVLDAVAYSRQLYERTKALEDWDLHLDCVRLAARVIGRIANASAT